MYSKLKNRGSRLGKDYALPEKMTSICLLVLCAGAAFMDLRRRRIRNFWNYGFLAAGVSFRLGAGGAIEGLLGLALPLLLLGGFYLLHMLGAGDVKLFCAAGMWIGSKEMPEFLLLSFLTAGILALGISLRRGNLKARFSYLALYLRQLFRGGGKADYLAGTQKKDRLPLAVGALAAAAIKTAEVWL